MDDRQTIMDPLPYEDDGFLREFLELEVVLKESSLDEEVAQRIALWTKGYPHRVSSISPSLSKVMDIMNTFTAEDMIDNIKENNPKNIQSEIKIQKLPTEIITQIFEMLSKDFLEMLSLSVYPGFSKGASGSDAYCKAICLGLTCRHYWAAFSRTWCHAGTNMIIYRPPPSQKTILALLLKTWVGPEYRLARGGSSWTLARVPMFLSQNLYGSMESLAERRLEERYEDQLRLYTCRSTPSTTGLPSQYMSSKWKGVSSLFGMGEAWYTEAGRQMCAGLDCCLIAPVLGNDYNWSEYAAWRSFRQTHLYRWAHSQELFPISKFQEKIKERLRSYEKSYEECEDHRHFEMHHSSWYMREWYVSE